MATTQDPKPIVAKCPVTGADVFLPADVEIGELVDSPEADIELEVVSLDPPTLAAAPEEEEDWGE